MTSSGASPQKGALDRQQTGEAAYLVVGKLRRPHGVHGEMLMEVLTDFPERIGVGITLYAGPEHTPLKVTKVRWQNTAMLLTFQGYHTPEAVGTLRNQLVCVLSSDRPSLPEGEYYHHQILGLQVFTPQGELIGVITDILETGANDVLVVRPPAGAEILLPVTDEVILAVELEKGRVTAQILPGLLADEVS
jgi:16S rRNA processing protein RimM